MWSGARGLVWLLQKYYEVVCADCRGWACLYYVAYVEQNQASGLMPSLPDYKKRRRVKGEVDTIDYHAFVINLPTIPSRLFGKEETHSHQGI